MMIPRELENVIVSKLHSRKAIIVLGPRQTGKTTLLSKIASKLGNQLVLNCDDPFTRNQLENSNTMELKGLIGRHKTIFIDEAQRVRNIGLTLKLLYDEFKEVQLLVSGSSALDLLSEISEPLTGRKWEYCLYPVSWKELTNYDGYLNALKQLERRLIFGMYPEVVNNVGSESELIKQIIGSYLYKDLLSYKGIRKPEILEKLLKVLALQIGSEVSYNEISNLLQIDKNTVSNYIDLLEKAFVIFRLHPFSRNLRNEISTNRKIYFYDTGIRNGIINNFNPFEYRNDVGALWENFLIAERIKFCHYHPVYTNFYFWRTHQGQEIDLIEERGGKLHGFEFKWKTKKKDKLPGLFVKTYDPITCQTVDSKNFHEFIELT